jgi:hypothetical protein
MNFDRWYVKVNRPTAADSIDVCATNGPERKLLLHQSGLPLGALGPLAAQQST